LAELVVIRHAQASFGAADYDVLSARGHRQSAALGRALAGAGLRPDVLFTGAQRRHRETLEGMAGGLTLDAGAAQVHEGLNEFDFKGLLDARFRQDPSARPVAQDADDPDRRAHFRVLRDAVLAWQRDEIAYPPETWGAFCTRVAAARDAMVAALAHKGGGTLLAVSSGGALGRLVASALGAPAEQMIRLQLQMKNCAMSRLIVGRDGLYLHSFNETPHVDAQTAPDLLSYS